MLLPKTWIICRVCLKQHEQMLNIFDDKIIKSAWTLLRDCGGVPVRKNDDLPDKICEVCLRRLWNASTFRNDCQRGHRELVQMLMERKINMYELDLKDEKKFCCSDIISISDTTNEYPASSLTTRPVSQTSNTATNNRDTNENKSTNRNIKQYYVVVRNENKDEKIPEKPTKPTGKNEPIVLLLKLKNIPQLKDESETTTNDTPIETVHKLRKDIQNTVKGVSSSSSSIKTETKLNEKENLKTTTKAKSQTNSITRLKSKFKNTKNSIKEKTQFSCRVCKKSFSTYILLRHHNYIHNRPHQCKICKKRFSQINSFLGHNNMHSGIKPYYCRFCYRAFADISNRNAHERKQHTNETFKCEKCNKVFRFLSLLRKHAQVHRPKICLVCNKDFASLQSVRRHHQHKHLKLWNGSKC